MAKYLALYHIKGDMDFMFGSGADQKLVGRIAEFDGTLDEAKQYFGKQAFYGGNASAKPEEYESRYYGFLSNEPAMVVVAPFDESMKQPLDSMLNEHNEIHRRLDAKRKEDRERAELKRLQDKYGPNAV